MISHFFKSFLLGVLFVDFVERRFPQQFRSFLTDITFNALYFYSKFQIYFAKVNKQFNDFVDSSQILSKLKNELNTFTNTKKAVTLTQFIKNGEYLCLEEASNCDFGLFSWLGDDNKCINKKIIYDINEPMTMAECSDIKFMLVEIQNGENKYKVDLKTDDYNYYLVDNKFTKQFFIYYLKKNLYINQPINHNDKFTLKIIDHDVNTVEINFTDKNESIILEKNGYKVVKND
jgi:hypothetical protein